VVVRLDPGLEQLDCGEGGLLDERADHGGREPLATVGGVDRERD
jgi:hypothetical protein